MCGQEGPGPLNWNSMVCLMSIFSRYFLKSILCVKTGEVDLNRYWKMVPYISLLKNSTKIATLTKHVILGPDLRCAGPLALWGFCNIFLPDISKDQKKSYQLSAGPWHCAIWQIRRWLLHYDQTKFKWGPEVATLWTKPMISPWLYV